MTVSTTPLNSPLGAAIIVDTDVTATAVNNVRGAPSTVYVIEGDNTLNGSESFIKIYNLAAPIVGTDPPYISIPLPANGTGKWNNLAGKALSVALSYACVTNGGGTAGTSSPSSDVTLRILCT